MMVPDLVQTEKLGRIYATMEEVAAWFNVERRTVVRWLATNPAFAEALERGKAQGRITLRQAQIQCALRGNPAMLIWLGKQLLGQKEVVEHAHSGEMTMTTEGARDRLLSKLASLAAERATPDGDSRPN